MAAQMKDYAYSDNADVLKGKVNAGKPVPKNSGNITAQMKDLNPPNPLARDSSRETLRAKSQAMHARLADKKKSDSLIASKGSSPDRSQFVQDVNNAARAVGNTFGSVGSWARDGIKDLANTPFMPETRDYLFGTQKSTLDKEGSRLAAASNSNTFKGTPGSPFAKTNSSGTTNTVPSRLIGAQQEAGTSRFDKSKLTLGNNPYTGQVGMFKNGEMISNQDAATALGQKGKGQFLGKFSSPVGGVTDFTNLFAQDQKLFQAQMAAVKRGDGSGIFTGPADPGAGRYGQGSQMSSLQSRRDMLQGKVDLYNRNNPIVRGSSVGDIISNTVATQQMRDEIKHIDDTIFGKNDLANKIQQEIIRANAGIAEQQLRNQGSLDLQSVSGQYGLAEQAMRNQGAIDAQNIAGQNSLAERAMQIKGEKDISRQNNMFNALMNKQVTAKFGDTEDSFRTKNAIELQKKQAETLYQNQIEEGKSPEEALRTVKASFPDIYLMPDDDEKRVEGI